MWDIVNGILMVELCGGVLTDLTGQPWHPLRDGHQPAARSRAIKHLTEESTFFNDVQADNPTQSESAQLPALKKSTPKGLSRKNKDLLAHYLAEVRKYPLLSREEEKEYAVSYQETGDRQAAEKLVTNLRLVIKIAFQYHRQWAGVLDLIQEGNVGLVEALSRYDPSETSAFHPMRSIGFAR